MIFYWFKIFLTANLQHYFQKINSKIMYNLLKFNILKDAKTIQKVTISMRKKAGIPWFKFSGIVHGFWMDPKILEVFGKFLP